MPPLHLWQFLLISLYTYAYDSSPYTHTHGYREVISIVVTRIRTQTFQELKAQASSSLNARLSPVQTKTSPLIPTLIY